MIAAIPVMSNKKEAQLSLKFARSPFFALVNREFNTYRFIENPFAEDEEGVGTKILTLLYDENAVVSLVAFELGLKLQQYAKSKGLQFIILNENNNKLADILNLMELE